MKNHIIINSSVLLFALFIASCGGNSKPVETITSTFVDVQTITLSSGQISAPITIPGQLIPYNNVELYAKENSYVKTLNADIGTNVKKGQLLVTLEAPEMISQYNQAQADMNTKLAIYKGSKANYERLYQTSKTPGTISPNDLDLALAKASADSAQWKAAQSNFHQAADLLNYLAIKAPFDGVITARNVSPGAYVGPGDKNTGKPMLVLQEQDKLRLTMNIAEQYTGYLNNKDSISFTVRSLTGQKFMAHISRKAGGIDPQTRTEQVEMDVNNDHHLLLPQMYADINLNIEGHADGFEVPRTSLVQNAERVFVIKVINNKAIWVDVKKGIENATSITIMGKLKAGDVLVTNATDEIRPGTLLNSTAE